ncbi:hypothetical protein Scep_007660 [Stephania cephalantha]|uniref:Uncharacterized protein n=1 Tax=Stephania cephalantha TaxID=152367 RepID=A0AAP0KA97_9MAGN
MGSTSNGGLKVAVSSSPKGGNNNNNINQGASPNKSGTVGQCLCSPTTHQGSFRCRFHRSVSSAWMRRSNSMPSASASTVSKTVQSTT